MGAPFVSGQSVVRGETHQFVGPAHVTGYTQGGIVGVHGSSALALDAADGVIDGKFFGAGITQTQTQTTYPAAYSGYAAQRSFVTGPAYGAASSALALDAADGVIDGKFFGAGIVNHAAYPAAYPAARSFVTGTTYGAPSSALALDAADGVIDGKFFGSNIVGQPRPYGF
jgi:hypothetical protein